MVIKKARQNKLIIGKWPFWSKYETFNRGINIEHKQIPKNISTDDENYHGTQNIKFFLYLLVKSVSKSLKFGLKWQFLYFKPTLLAILVTIATGKSIKNARTFHLDYFSNKPIKMKLVKSNFQCLALEGAKIAP